MWVCGCLSVCERGGGDESVCVEAYVCACEYSYPSFIVNMSVYLFGVRLLQLKELLPQVRIFDGRKRTGKMAWSVDEDVQPSTSISI